MRFGILLLALALTACSASGVVTKEGGGEVEASIARIRDHFDDPAEISRVIETATAEERWQLLFAYGEYCGTRLGLSEASERTAVLGDEESRWHFWDGYAHSAPWPGDDPAIHVARIRMLSGQRVHAALEDGVLLRYAQRNADDPEKIVTYAHEWMALTHRSPTNGVRIGIQRALGADMGKAIATAAKFPAEWQPDLYEELGWRVGLAPDAAIRDTQRFLPTVPEASQCSFVHGAVRGHALHVSLDSAMVLARQLNGTCSTEAWKAIGWTVHQQHPYEPESAEKVAATVGSTEAAAILAGYREQTQMSNPN